MKKRTLILIGTVAIVTLSFTFSTTNKQSDEVKKTAVKTTEPAGGFASNDIQK